MAALPPPTEADEQKMLAQWLDMRGLLWCHVPNGGHRNIITATKLKAQGVKAGVPDILIFTPPPKCRECVGTAVELKRTVGSRPTPAQREWLGALDECGWLVLIGRGCDDTITQLVQAGY